MFPLKCVPGVSGSLYPQGSALVTLVKLKSFAEHFHSQFHAAIVYWTPLIWLIIEAEVSTYSETRNYLARSDLIYPKLTKKKYNVMSQENLIRLLKLGGMGRRYLGALGRGERKMRKMDWGVWKMKEEQVLRWWGGVLLLGFRSVFGYP